MALLDEPHLSLTALARRKGKHVSTVWRWCLRGVGGHRLESLVIGGQRFTSEAAFVRWVEALNGVVAPLSGETGRGRDDGRTHELLRSAGLIDAPATELNEAAVTRALRKTAADTAAVSQENLRPRDQTRSSTEGSNDSE